MLFRAERMLRPFFAKKTRVVSIDENHQNATTLLLIAIFTYFAFRVTSTCT